MTIEGVIICYFHQMCPFKVERYIGPYLVLPFMMIDILFQVIPQSNKIDLLQKKFQRRQRGLMEYLKNQTDAVLHSFWFQRLFNASLGFFFQLMSLQRDQSLTSRTKIKHSCLNYF